jgi:predicted PurR-regulated permease PerM
MLATRRQQAAILIGLVGVAVALALLPFASGLLGIPVLYVLCAPFHGRLARWIRPKPAAVLLLLVALALILLPGLTLLGMVVGEAPGTLRAVQESDLFARLATLRMGDVPVGEELVQASGQLFSWASSSAMAFFGGATRVVFNLAIAFFGVYYLLVTRETVWEHLRPHVPFSPARADALRHRFQSVTEATVVGIVFTALAQGALIGAGFALTGLPSPVFWGAVTALASVVPVVGSTLVWGPAVLVLALSGRFAAAAVLALIGFVNSNVDNVIRLVVYRRVSDIHPMITLVGAFAGLRYFGLLGVLIGPLALAYFFELLRMYREDYVPAPPPPVELGRESLQIRVAGAAASE